MSTTHDFPKSACNHELPIPGYYAGYVDKKAIAQFLGISTRTIETWIREKKIPHIRLGGKFVRFRIADVEEALSKHYLVKEVLHGASQ